MCSLEKAGLARLAARVEKAQNKSLLQPSKTKSQLPANLWSTTEALGGLKFQAYLWVKGKNRPIHHLKPRVRWFLFFDPKPYRDTWQKDASSPSPPPSSKGNKKTFAKENTFGKTQNKSFRK